MEGLFSKMEASPARMRVIPFVAFVVPMALHSYWDAASPYWIYFVRTLLGALLVWWMWPRVREMRWALSWEAVVAGVGVFVLWVGLDRLVPPLMRSEEAVWNPNLVYGEGTAMAWFFVVVRLVGSTVVVPPMEEVFYRSFFYRYFIQSDFLGVPLRRFDLRAFVFTCAVFGFVHHEWLAGMLCGAVYQGLVLRKGRLGDSMTAHAITNCLLAIWVITRGAWQFW